MEEELLRVMRDRGLTISNLTDKGRSLFTTRDFHPGEIIISQEPYVCVPNNSMANSRCDGCFTSVNLKRCSACQVVWYCGSTCQKSEWKLHRLECDAFSRIDRSRRKSVTPTIRLMVKLNLQRKLQSEKVIPSTATDNYSLVKELVDHMSLIDENQLVLYAQMANLVHLILQQPEISIKEIAQNFSKFACNAHTICDSELRPLGTGLYLVISIINHSCSPNSVLTFEGKCAVVRAVQYIPKDAEVLISYIDTAGSIMTRQKSLKEQYLFTCRCNRCSKTGQDAIIETAVLEGYRCKDYNCNGFLVLNSDGKGFVCQHCGLLRSKAEIKHMAFEIKAASDKAVSFTSSNNHWGAVTIYKIIENLQGELFHPFSTSLLQTREKLLEILMKLEDWGEAITYCRLTIPAYGSLYPGLHPLLGLQYYACGKLEWLQGDTENAIKSLMKAVDILRYTHGTSTPFMKELFQKLEEARAEASYKISYRN